MPKFSPDAQRAVEQAVSFAREMDHSRTGLEHLLLALSYETSVRIALVHNKINLREFTQDVRSACLNVTIDRNEKDAKPENFSYLLRNLIGIINHDYQHLAEVNSLQILASYLKNYPYTSKNSIKNRYRLHRKFQDFLSSSELHKLIKDQAYRDLREKLDALPRQVYAPVRVEERGGKISLIENREVVAEVGKDIDRWRVPVTKRLNTLLAREFATGTNHERIRSALLDVNEALSGNIDEVKVRQFELGYSIESLGDIVEVYRNFADDVPTLNAAVFADINRLHIQLMLGLSKFVAWSSFQRAADADELHEGSANPAAVGAALAEAEAVLAGDAAAPIVDPELPRSFRWIREAIADPKETTKRMVYGAVKSLENVGSFLGQLTLRTAKEATENAAQGISTRAAALLLTALSSALLYLSGALPVAWPWLKPLLEAAAKVVGG